MDLCGIQRNCFCLNAGTGTIVGCLYPNMYFLMQGLLMAGMLFGILWGNLKVLNAVMQMGKRSLCNCSCLIKPTGKFGKQRKFSLIVASIYFPYLVLTCASLIFFSVRTLAAVGRMACFRHWKHVDFFFF